MLRSTRRLIQAATLVVLSGGVVAAADIPTGTVLASSCLSCHGADGRGAGAMPAIATLDAVAIERRLREFRDGRGEATIMDRVAKALTDEEISQLSRYFGGNR